MSEQPSQQLISTEKRDGLLLVGFDRAAKRNAFPTAMLTQLAQAYTAAEDDDDVRCLVVHAAGDHFTAGLDLAEVAPSLRNGLLVQDESLVDPWQVRGRRRTKPVVVAVQGICLTLGIELMLAADVRVAAADARFGQIEVARGIYPFGGATLRFPRECGWGNAMRWMLTSELFDAAEALRIGLVQEVVDPGRQLDRAVEIATTIAAQAPLGVRAVLASSRTAVEEARPDDAAGRLHADLLPLLDSEDAAEGVASFVERRAARFTGR
jgi:enoyl-CoA hydratase/carnithine racemase